MQSKPYRAAYTAARVGQSDMHLVMPCPGLPLSLEVRQNDVCQTLPSTYHLH